MILGGAIEFDTGEIVTLLAVIALMFLALCATGGLVAAAIARKPRAFLAGTAVFGMVVLGMTGMPIGTPPLQSSLLVGWAASGITGFALRDRHDPDHW